MNRVSPMLISLTTFKRIVYPFVIGLLLAWGLMVLDSGRAVQAFLRTSSHTTSHFIDSAATASSDRAVPGSKKEDQPRHALSNAPSNPPAPLPEWIIQASQIPQAEIDHAHGEMDTHRSADHAQMDNHGNKSIAIDAAPNAGTTVPNVVEMNELQIAAQIWASASFPVESFQAYTSPFGYRSSPTGGYRKEFHYGLDIAAPRHSYIRNWWAGTVIEVSDGSNCGTSAVIQSGEWTHMYCHMQGHVENRGGTLYLVDRGGGVELRQGQHIAAGDRIGRIGMTGRTTGPHLHWGLKYQRNWVDPAWVLQAMAASYNALYGQ